MKINGKIVFVNQATGYITIDIINTFADVFDEVAVIYGDIRVQDVELNQKVRKSKIAEKSRKNNFYRFLKWLIASFQIYFLLITKYRRYEIFYFSVPPFAYLLSIILRRRFSVFMWDVYPDALKIADIKESNLIYRFWRNINRNLFKKAYKLYTIGDSLKNLMAHYTESDKIKVINLWSGLNHIENIEKRENPFIRKYKLENKFIVQYSGNIGSGHNIETIIEVAELTKEENDILFLIIGRGQKFKSTQEIVSKKNLRNFLFLPFLPDDMIQYTLRAADIGIVLIDKRAANVSIPSKIYNYIAAGTTILSVSPENSAVNSIVNKYEIGKNYNDIEISEIKKFILDAKQDSSLLKKYKINLSKAHKFFTSSNAKQILYDYIGELN
jgi:hypothetical protein